MRRGTSASGLSPLVVETLGERILLTGNVGIDVPDNAVPGETVAVQVLYSGDNGGGQNGGAFVDTFGDTLLARTATGVDVPVDGIFVGDTIQVIGQDDGKAASQHFDSVGSSQTVTHFESLLSAQGNGGNQSGAIGGAARLPTGEVIYVGQSAGSFDVAQPTYWLEPETPQGGLNSVGQAVSGFYSDVSTVGGFVGSGSLSALYGFPSNLPKLLPGIPSPGAAVSISTNGQFIVGDYIWTANTLDGYDVLNTANFDFTVSGTTPTWQGVELDSTGEVYFAGSYLDLNTFSDAVGFWNGAGEFLGEFGVTFADFDVVGGDVIAAVNGFDDGTLVRVRDGATVSIESLIGSQALFPAKGLFANENSLGLLLQDASGPFVTVIATNTGSVDPDRVDFHLDFDGDGTIDQVIADSAGATVETHYLRPGTYTATVIAKDSAGNELARSSNVVQVTPFRVVDRNGTAVLLVGANQSRGSSVNVTQIGSSLQVTVDGRVRRVIADSVEVIGSPRTDVVVLSGSFSAVVNLGAGHDVLTSIGVDLDADLGNGNDVATSIGGHTVRLNGGNGNDVLLSVNHRFVFLDGGDGNDILTSNGFSSFIIGGAGADLFTVFDKRTVVVTDDLQTSSDLERRTLVDTVFAELGKASPNMNSLSNQLQSLRIDDGVRDSGLVLSGLNRVLQTPRDRLLILPVLF